MITLLLNASNNISPLANHPDGSKLLIEKVFHKVVPRSLLIISTFIHIMQTILVFASLSIVIILFTITNILSINTINDNELNNLVKIINSQMQKIYTRGFHQHIMAGTTETAHRSLLAFFNSIENINKKNIIDKYENKQYQNMYKSIQQSIDSILYSYNEIHEDQSTNNIVTRINKFIEKIISDNGSLYFCKNHVKEIDKLEKDLNNVITAIANKIDEAVNITDDYSNEYNKLTKKYDAILQYKYDYFDPIKDLYHLQIAIIALKKDPDIFYDIISVRHGSIDFMKQLNDLQNNNNDLYNRLLQNMNGDNRNGEESDGDNRNGEESDGDNRNGEESDEDNEQRSTYIPNMTLKKDDILPLLRYIKNSQHINILHKTMTPNGIKWWETFLDPIRNNNNTEYMEHMKNIHHVAHMFKNALSYIPLFTQDWMNTSNIYEPKLNDIYLQKTDELFSIKTRRNIPGDFIDDQNRLLDLRTTSDFHIIKQIPRNLYHMPLISTFKSDNNYLSRVHSHYQREQYFLKPYQESTNNTSSDNNNSPPMHNMYSNGITRCLDPSYYLNYCQHITPDKLFLYSNIGYSQTKYIQQHQINSVFIEGVNQHISYDDLFSTDSIKSINSYLKTHTEDLKEHERQFHLLSQENVEVLNKMIEDIKSYDSQVHIIHLHNIITNQITQMIPTLVNIPDHITEPERSDINTFIQQMDDYKTQMDDYKTQMDEHIQQFMNILKNYISTGKNLNSAIDKYNNSNSTQKLEDNYKIDITNMTTWIEEYTSLNPTPFALFQIYKKILGKKTMDTKYENYQKYLLHINKLNTNSINKSTVTQEFINLYNNCYQKTINYDTFNQFLQNSIIQQELSNKNINIHKLYEEYIKKLTEQINKQNSVNNKIQIINYAKYFLEPLSNTEDNVAKKKLIEQAYIHIFNHINRLKNLFKQKDQKLDIMIKNNNIINRWIQWITGDSNSQVHSKHIVEPLSTLELQSIKDISQNKISLYKLLLQKYYDIRLYTPNYSSIDNLKHYDNIKYNSIDYLIDNKNQITYFNILEIPDILRSNNDVILLLSTMKYPFLILITFIVITLSIFSAIRSVMKFVQIKEFKYHIILAEFMQKINLNYLNSEDTILSNHVEVLNDLINNIQGAVLYMINRYQSTLRVSEIGMAAMFFVNFIVMPVIFLNIKKLVSGIPFNKNINKPLIHNTYIFSHSVNNIAISIAIPILLRLIDYYNDYYHKHNDTTKLISDVGKGKLGIYNKKTKNKWLLVIKVYCAILSVILWILNALTFIPNISNSTYRYNIIPHQIPWMSLYLLLAIIGIVIYSSYKTQSNSIMLPFYGSWMLYKITTDKLAYVQFNITSNNILNISVGDRIKKISWINGNIIFDNNKNQKINKKLHIFKNTSFDITSDNNTIIVGPTGSGKTTILNHINGTDGLKLEYGEVNVLVYNHKNHRYEYHDLNSVNTYQLRNKIKLMPQTAHILGQMNIRDFIELLLPKNLDDKVLNIIIDILNVGQEIKYDLSREYKTLSGGQKKRLFISVMLMTNMWINDFDIVSTDEVYVGIQYKVRKDIYKMLGFIDTTSEYLSDIFRDIAPESEEIHASQYALSYSDDESIMSMQFDLENQLNNNTSMNHITHMVDEAIKNTNIEYEHNIVNKNIGTKKL